MINAMDNLLDRLLGIDRGEEVVLLVDDGTDRQVVEGLLEGIDQRNAVPIVVQIPEPFLPGSEPPTSVAALMKRAGVVIELTSLFIGSNRARQQANAEGTRYAAMPGVRLSTFRDGGPLTVDFEQIRTTAEWVGRAWTEGGEFHLTTPAGTDLRASIKGRQGRVLHGICRTSGDYMAPPDIEAGAAPLEGTANGVVVVDADFLFMGQGPVTEPVALYFRDGELVGVEGGEASRLNDMLERCSDPRMSNLAEVSLGLNPASQVCEVPMETEAALGTAHIALGNSIAYGGTVDAIAHLDCVVRQAVLEIDGRLIIENGALT